MNNPPPSRDVQERSSELAVLFGFTPTLFRAQADLPCVVAAEAQLLNSILGSDAALTRDQKAGIALAVARVSKNKYCEALFGSLPSVSDRSLVAFSSKLASQSIWFSAANIDELRKAGFAEAAILDAIAAAATAQLFCTISAALQPKADSEIKAQQPAETATPAPPSEWQQTSGPYLSITQLSSDPHLWRPLQQQMGFVPNLFRAQTLLPELVKAEVDALDRILFPEDHLSRIQKEMIALLVSAENLNTYLVAMHSQMLSVLGVSSEESELIIDSINSSSIPEQDKALLSEARKLTLSYAATKGAFDCEQLRRQGFTEPQIIEAAAMAGLSNFFNILQFGLGPSPDFPPSRIFTPKDLYLSSESARPTFEQEPAEDPDAVVLAQIKNGETDKFEELIRRHSQRVFRTLSGILGNADDARDTTQDVFLKAFEKLSDFEGRSRFSTWLLSIAINTGTEVLRRRKPLDPFSSEEEDGFRPRLVQHWAADPEQLFSAAQRSELVRDSILHLPEKYRTALILRDINEMSTEDSATALGLTVAALKARVLRARLMLRERLAPHFTSSPDKVSDA